MGIYGNILKLFRKSTDFSALVQNYQGIVMNQDPGYSSLSYGSMAREGYVYNPTVRDCVDIINKGLRSLPLYLMETRQTPQGAKTLHRGRHPSYMKKSAASTEEMPDDHPLLKLLKSPNLRMTRGEFLNFVSGSLLLDGNSFIVPVNPKTRTGPPIGLYPLRPDMVRVEEVKVGGISTLRYTYSPSADGQPIAESKTYGEAEIIHIKLYNPLDGLRGLGVVSAARMATDRANAGEKWNYSLLKNSARTTGYLKPPPGTSENQKEQILKMRDKMVGMLNAGQVPVMPGLDWQQISLSPLDMDWLGGGQDADLKIARAFGVPGQKLGIPGSQTYANMEQADRAFYQDNVVPFGMGIIEKFNSNLTPLYSDGLELLIDTDAIPAMRESQNDLYNRANMGWWLSLDQKLQMTGFETVGGKLGSTIFIPANLIPMELAMASGDGDEGDQGAGENTGDEDQGAGSPFGGGAY